MAPPPTHAWRVSGGTTEGRQGPGGFTHSSPVGSSLLASASQFVHRCPWLFIGGRSRSPLVISEFQVFFKNCIYSYKTKNSSAFAAGQGKGRSPGDVEAPCRGEAGGSAPQPGVLSSAPCGPGPSCSWTTLRDHPSNYTHMETFFICDRGRVTTSYQPQ